MSACLSLFPHLTKIMRRRTTKDREERRRNVTEGGRRTH